MGASTRLDGRLEGVRGGGRRCRDTAMDVARPFANAECVLLGLLTMLRSLPCRLKQCCEEGVFSGGALGLQGGWEGGGQRGLRCQG